MEERLAVAGGEVAFWTCLLRDMWVFCYRGEEVRLFQGSCRGGEESLRVEGGKLRKESIFLEVRCFWQGGGW